MATGVTTNYFLPYPLSTDPVRVAGDIEQLATKIDNDLQEIIEDKTASMWTGGTFNNGINTPTYNDTTGKMSMSLAQDLRTTATPTFTGVNLVGGDLYLGPSRSINFEGTTNDSFKTTFTVTDPTANRTITFQNATGTVAFTSESTMASLVNIANSTGAITAQFGYGATTNATTKTINIGPNGVSGSITNINIGSSVTGATGTTTINSPTTSLLGDITIATGKAYKINSVNVLTSTTLGTSVVSSSLTSVGTITSGTWSASFGAVSGANLTNLTAGNLTGTIPSIVLGNSTVYIGTTAIALNRATASQSLTGITSIDGSAATLTTGRTIGMTGDVTWTSASFNGSGNVTGTSTISNSAVTYAKIQNISAQYRVLGRITTAAGVVEELTPNNMVTLIGQSSTITGTGNIVFSGSPTFSGTITAATINASAFNSTGSDLTLLSAVSGAPSSNASIVVNRGTSSDVSIRWNESLQSWEFTNDGTTFTSIGSGTSGGGSANITDILMFAGM